MEYHTSAHKVRVSADHLRFLVIMCPLCLMAQLLTKHFSTPMSDIPMWGNQIKYLLENDPRVFDFYRAYGHPGTTLLEVGSLLHVVLGFSYDNAIIWSICIINAFATTCCALVCTLIRPGSPWWIATAMVLTFNTLSLYVTPPTEVVMALIVFIVLLTWLILEKTCPPSGGLVAAFGAGIGIAAATRLDATALVSMPLMFLVLQQHGSMTLLKVAVCALTAFFLANPFLWFMPIQHVKDLAHKFTLHHSSFTIQERMDYVDLLHVGIPALGSFALLAARLVRGGVIRSIPNRLLAGYAGVTIVAAITILTSDYQTVRYFCPILIVWDVWFPFLAIDALEWRNSVSGAAPDRAACAIKYFIIVFCTMQFLASHIGYTLLARALNHFYDGLIQL